VFALPPVAAPRPVLSAGAETGADRVVQHVGAGFAEVVVVPDHLAVEAVAEEVAGSAVPLVELLRVGAVQDLHARGEQLELGLDDQVVVVAEQAERVEAPAEAPHDDAEQAEEVPAILVVAVDPRPVDAAGGDVVVAARREHVAGQAGHRTRR
jgi:hypothetical protein